MSEDINDSTIGDVAYGATKGAIGMIPIVGSLGSELFGLVVTPPLEKRRAQLVNDILRRLHDLESVGRIDILKLSDNDHFIDTVMQATTSALRTSEKEKIESFKNTIINTASGNNPSLTKSYIFLGLLDKFTDWHILILKYLDNPIEWFHRYNMEPIKVMMGSISTNLFKAFPELEKNIDLLKIIWNDLNSAGFINTSDFTAMMNGESALNSRTTQMAKEFINYITTHE